MSNNNDLIRVSIEGKIEDAKRKILTANGAVVSSASSLMGGLSVTEIILLATTPIAIKALRDVLLTALSSRRRVSINTKTFQATDLDLATAEEILKAFVAKGTGNDAFNKNGAQPLVPGDAAR